MNRRTQLVFLFCALFALLTAACNLNNSQVLQETIQVSGTITRTGQATRTPSTTRNAPTTLPIPSSGAPTLSRPTSVVVVPATAVLPPPAATNTALPVSIVILSPVPGNVVAGNVQVLGAAAHPQFLQYQIEYGPDPNPSQLWYPASNAIQQPVINGVLGAWNTAAAPDGLYQLRLRVFMRDGTTLSTVVSNIRIQNRQPTPAPSATSSVPRPIAAFTQDVTSGQVPLTVRFTNQTNGTFTSAQWNFGDGQSSTEVSPAHTFNAPGLYNVTLTVSGPGGASNVTRQINVLSQSAPVAAFTQNTLSGTAPLTVQFTDQSTGNITTRLWNFSDGTTSNVTSPSHTFSVGGTYNVFLTVSGPGGTSTITRQIVVSGPPTATFTNIPPTATFTGIPPTATFTTEPPTGVPPTVTFTTEPPTAVPPTVTETPVPSTATFTTEPPTATLTETTIPLDVPIAGFTIDSTTDLTITLSDTSQGTIDSYEWDFDAPSGIDSTTAGAQTFTYPAAGTYTVRLVVSNASGASAPFEQTVTVTDAPPQPRPVDAVNLQPDLTQDGAALASTYTNVGIPAGIVANSFSVIGDELLTTQGVLAPFASGNYNLGDNADLQPLIEFYTNSASNPFGRPSSASSTGWTAADLMSADGVDPICGASRLACEIKTNSPAVVLVSVGYHDAINGTDPNAFRASLEQIVQTATAGGAIPVLLTVPTLPNLDPTQAAQVDAINTVILSVADTANVPLLNTGRAINETAAGLTEAGGGGGDLTAAAQGGVNALNLNILRTLDTILDTIAPGSVP